jgi:hypothetical protein
MVTKQMEQSFGLTNPLPISPGKIFTKVSEQPLSLSSQQKQAAAGFFEMNLLNCQYTQRHIPQNNDFIPDYTVS